MGTIICERREFGHHFRIEKLDEPVSKGAHLRYFRLWDGDEPASGGQWHYNLESAIARAEYLLEISYEGRIKFLEERVRYLEGQLYGNKARI